MPRGDTVDKKKCEKSALQKVKAFFACGQQNVWTFEEIKTRVDPI
jgi:hypothetical protein